MDYEKREELVRLHIQMRQATDSLQTRAEEVYKMAKEMEELTKDTTRSATPPSPRGWRRGLPSSRLRIYAVRWRRWVRR
jgi:hypothetical protein